MMLLLLAMGAGDLLSGWHDAVENIELGREADIYTTQLVGHAEKGVDAPGSYRGRQLANKFP